MVNVSKAPQYTIGRISQQGGAEVEGHDVTVGEGATVEVDATLMAGIVSVEGVVKKNGKPLSGVMVALVPKDPRTHLERFRRDQSDMDGTFMVGGILPGTYTLIAVEDGWGFAWMKEGVLEKYLAKGQQLNIGVMMNNKGGAAGGTGGAGEVTCDVGVSASRTSIVDIVSGRRQRPPL